MSKQIRGYARISRDPNEQRVGVQRQRREVTELAERLGLTIDTWHEDNDASAYSGKARPQFDALLADLSAGRVSALTSASLTTLGSLTREPYPPSTPATGAHAHRHGRTVSVQVGRVAPHIA